MQVLNLFDKSLELWSPYKNLRLSNGCLVSQRLSLSLLGRLAGSERERLLKQANISSPGDSAERREEMEAAMMQVLKQSPPPVRSEAIRCWRVSAPSCRCARTSWSSARRCCCRAPPRPSSASACSVRQAASRQAETERAQVAHIAPLTPSSLTWRNLCLNHFILLKEALIIIIVFLQISRPPCRPSLTHASPAWVWFCTCWRTALQISSSSTRATGRAWANCRAWSSFLQRSWRRSGTNQLTSDHRVSNRKQEMQRQPVLCQKRVNLFKFTYLIPEEKFNLEFSNYPLKWRL